jgi:hypothetical protein
MCLEIPDIVDCILSSSPELLCRLGCVNRALRDMLAGRVREQAYQGLCSIDLSSFSKHPRQCGLYELEKGHDVWRRQRSHNPKEPVLVKIHKYRFGFLTGQKDEWHTCVLTVPPLTVCRWARLRVHSLDSRGKWRVQRSFNHIRRVSDILSILRTRHWHSGYWIWGYRWSYLENQSKRALVLGLEE